MKTDSEIANRSKEEVIGILKDFGLGKSSRRKWQDYEIAKLAVFGGKSKFKNWKTYLDQMGCIIEYLKL